MNLIKIARKELFLRMTSHGPIDTNSREEQIKRNARKNGHLKRCHA